MIYIYTALLFLACFLLLGCFCALRCERDYRRDQRGDLWRWEHKTKTTYYLTDVNPPLDKES